MYPRRRHGAKATPLSCACGKEFAGGLILTGQQVDESFTLLPPFYTSDGRRIRVGHKVFITQCCTIYDLGGVEIGDLVMIGPNVNLITTGHAMDPSERRKVIESRPIVIGRNVWIATGATILGGVTVGDNAVVGAAAVVTRDVPPNTRPRGRLSRVADARQRQRDGRCRRWPILAAPQSPGHAQLRPQPRRVQSQA